MNDIQTITIPGAEKLNVTLKYGTESGYDYLNIYTGNPFSDNDDYDEYTEIIDTVSPVAHYDGKARKSCSRTAILRSITALETMMFI